MVWTTAAYTSPWNGQQFNPWTGELQAVTQPSVVSAQEAQPLAVSPSGLLDRGGMKTPDTTQQAESISSTPANERARQGMLGAFADAGKMGAAKGLGNLGTAVAMGAPVNVGNAAQSIAGGFVSPAAVTGLMGNVVAQQMGYSRPQGFMGKALSAIPGMALSAINPVVGAAYGLLGPTVTDGLMDATNSRRGEVTRDSMEDAYGYAGGRKAHSGLLGELQSGVPSSAKLSGLESLLNDLNPQYNTMRAATYLGGTSTNAPNTGWGNTTFGQLEQNRAWAARIDAEARAQESARARDAAALAEAARINAIAREGGGSVGGGYGSGMSDGGALGAAGGNIGGDRGWGR